MGVFSSHEHTSLANLFSLRRLFNRMSSHNHTRYLGLTNEVFKFYSFELSWHTLSKQVFPTKIITDTNYCWEGFQTLSLVYLPSLSAAPPSVTVLTNIPSFSRPASAPTPIPIMLMPSPSSSVKKTSKSRNFLHLICTVIW